MSDEIDVSAGKVFRTRAEIYTPLASYDISFLNPVEVRADGKTIGWASVEWDCGNLQCQIVLVSASPERLTIETDSEPLYAAAGGLFHLYDDPWEHSGILTQDVKKVQSGHLLYIDISRNKPHPFSMRLSSYAF